jgi:hypothetical protein
MKKADRTTEDDDMRAEYDFTGAERGRLARRYGSGVTLLVLDPEVTRVFGDADTAGRVLKALATALRPPRPRRRGPARRRARR